MLFLLSREWKRMKWQKIVPYFNEDKNSVAGEELLLMMSDNVGFKLTNIEADDGSTLFMKNIMEEKKDIFGEKSFEDRIKEFVPLFDTRLERLFVTRKVDYLFFDKEEQIFLKKLMEQVHITARVEILIKEEGKFKTLDFNSITARQMLKVKKYFTQAGVQFMCRPETHFFLKSKAGQVREEEKPMTPEQKQKKRNDILKKYPELNVEGHDAWKKGFRTLSKQLHSDVGGDDKKFQEFMEAVKFLKTTKWYKIKVGEAVKVEPTNVDQQCNADTTST